MAAPGLQISSHAWLPVFFWLLAPIFLALSALVSNFEPLVSNFGLLAPKYGLSAPIFLSPLAQASNFELLAPNFGLPALLLAPGSLFSRDGKSIILGLGFGFQAFSLSSINFALAFSSFH